MCFFNVLLVNGILCMCCLVVLKIVLVSVLVVGFIDVLVVFRNGVLG